MAAVDDDDGFKDALAGAAGPSPSKPRPAAAAGGGGGGSFGRRLLASIPIPASLSVAIGRFSGPKPPASNVGLGLLLHAAGPACSATDTPASDAASAGSGLHPPPLAPLQRQRGEDQVAGRSASAGEEGLGFVLAEEGRPTAAEGRGLEGVAVDGWSANRDCFPSPGNEEEGEQCLGDELGAAVGGSVAQDQDEEVVVEQGETTEDCAAVVEDQSNHSAVEQCAGYETGAAKDGCAVEVSETVMKQGSVGILDAPKDSVTVESQEEDVLVAEQGEDGISVQDQHEMVEQCTGDQLRAITDGNDVHDQEVVEQEGAYDCYTALYVVEQCTNDGPKALKDDNVLEAEERYVKQSGAVGVLGAPKDGISVESQEEGVVVAEQNEDGISVQYHGKVVEQCTGDQLRTTIDDSAAHDQEVVELGGPTEYCTAVEAVEQCTNDGSRAVNDDNVVEESEKEVEHEVAAGVLDAAKDYVTVESQEEDVVVAGQGEDAVFLRDQHTVVEQCASGHLRTTMYDNAAEGQEVVEQEGAIVDRDATTDVIAVDQEKEVEESDVHESRATKYENAVEVNKKAMDPEDVVEKHGAIKAVGAVELLEKSDVMAVEQDGDVISLQDEGSLLEQYNSDKLRASTYVNDAENQEVVEQGGAIVGRILTTDGISVEDQEKEVEQFAGGESKATKDDNGVEDNEKVDQEAVIAKQGIIKDGSGGVESLEEDNPVVVEQGGDDFSVLDVDNVVEQCASGQLRTTMEDNAAECQEVVVQEGAIFERGVSDGIPVEDQNEEVEQSAGDESRATKEKNAVEDNNEEVDQEDAIDKHDATKYGDGVESQEEEDVVVPDQGVDVISVLNEDTCNLVVQCTSDQLRTTTDDNAAENPEVAEQEGVISTLGAPKVSISMESREDIVIAEQVEDDVSVQYQDKGVDQCTSDQPRTTIHDNAAEDQEVHRENIGDSAGYPQKPGKLNCRFYMSTGRCSYGPSCHFNHSLFSPLQMKPKLELSSFPSEQRDHEVEFLELNRVGLPIREGARKCTYYMRNGTCRYGKKCCYNHPEQVLDTQLHTPTGWDDTNLQSSPHSKKSPEHATIDDNDVSSGSGILPPNIIRMLLPCQNVPPCTEEKEMKVKKDPEWSSALDDSDGCCSADSSDGPLCKQEHMDYPERPECPFLLKFGNCKFSSSCKYYHPKDKFPSRYHPEDKFPSKYHARERLPSRYHPKTDPTLAEELTVYPDRPGEPECPFYVKTGSCKFGTNCKFHHPKDLTPSLQDSASPKRSVAANEHHPAAGTTLQNCMYQQQKYPERPGQPDCRYYMQFGKCKFQSACIFNHPKDILSSGWHPAECPSYMKTGTCQFGSACEFHHLKDRYSSKGDGTDYEHDLVTKSEIVLQQHEQTMYPERPGEPECPHYMKHGYCKFQMRCRFHHPAECLLTK
ncbi:hypothetical protein U9M48_010199 [Paspalum notatum var. saurae]|uniref:C3H1-type domain-containing protein n=1 Tax=Paspalum notatum var. saurae TaxID=547442 RepID=A0AAQ3WFW8_PASNO